MLPTRYYKIYLYAKSPYEAKYQLLINKGESTALKYCEDSKAFIGYSNDMGDMYKNIKNIKIFYDMIVDMLSNRKLNPIVTELFIRGTKLNISLFLLHNFVFLY